MMTNTMDSQIRELEEMKLPDLQQRFAEVVGEGTKAPNRKYLVRRIAEALAQNGDCEDMHDNAAETFDVDDSDDREIETADSSCGDRDYLTEEICPALQETDQTTNPASETRSARAVKDCRVLPLRMETQLVEKIDDAWKRLGLKSRMHLFRLSLKIYLESTGETEAAEMLEI